MEPTTGHSRRRSGGRVLALFAGLGLVMAAFAGPVGAVSTPTNPEPDLTCPTDYGTGMLTQYTTTVETPADSEDWYVSVEFTIEGADASCQLSLSAYELPSNEFTVPQTVFDHEAGTFGAGTHTLTIALPRQGSVDTCFSQYDFAFGPAIEELTETNRYGDRQVRARIVGSESCDIDGGEQPAATGTVMVMKHVCPDSIQTVEQFDALGGFLQKVLACPVITRPGDSGPEGALDADDDFFAQFVEGGTTPFNFTVAASNGSWTLDDSTFMPAQVCETDLGADANGDGTISADVCVEVSHYAVGGVAEGGVTVTESAPPAGFRFGDIEFTPGSGDADTLVGIDPAAGVVNLDTTGDDGTTGEGEAGPHSVMIHVYNFANVSDEGEQPGTPSPSPREDTAGGNPGGQGGTLPDTAGTAPASSPTMLVAFLIALTALAGGALPAVQWIRRR